MKRRLEPDIRVAILSPVLQQQFLIHTPLSLDIIKLIPPYLPIFIYGHIESCNGRTIYSRLNLTLLDTNLFCEWTKLESDYDYFGNKYFEEESEKEDHDDDKNKNLVYYRHDIIVDKYWFKIEKQDSKTSQITCQDLAPAEWLKMDTFKYLSCLKNCHGNSIVVLPNLHFFLFGGNGTIGSRSSARYNPKENKLLASTNMNTKRSFCASLLHGDFIYAFGGVQKNQAIISCERFNIKNEQWERIADLNGPRGGGQCVLLKDKVILLLGGSILPERKQSLDVMELYDIVNNTWSVMRDKSCDFKSNSYWQINGTDVPWMRFEAHMIAETMQVVVIPHFNAHDTMIRSFHPSDCNGWVSLSAMLSKIRFKKLKSCEIRV